MDDDVLLRVHDLRVTFPTDDGLVHAVNGMDLQVRRGQTVGIVGESGSGKTVTSQALMGLLKDTTARVEGEIVFDGVDLVPISETQMRAYRGDRIGMIFQDPLSAMHPYYTVGAQIAEAYRVHNGGSKKAARERTVDMLHRVGIPNPAGRYDAYPHQFSGGMRQRAMIAMALICEPELLIADEPTTALDVTVQAQILDLIESLRAETHAAVVFITHDLGVVAEVCQRVTVMYGGQCVEEGDVRDIFHRTAHPYTKGLMASMPSMADEKGRLTPIPGYPPSLLDLPQGCLFAARCPVAHLVPDGLCTRVRPELHTVGEGHRSRCHLNDPEILARLSPAEAEEATR